MIWNWGGALAKFRFYEWLMAWFFAQERFYFDWDAGNSTKSLQKHKITCEEMESVFEDLERIKILGIQISPETSEDRFGLFGKTKNNKNLFVSFTIRESKIRIISARELNQKENKLYETLCKE